MTNQLSARSPLPQQWTPCLRSTPTKGDQTMIIDFTSWSFQFLFIWHLFQFLLPSPDPKHNFVNMFKPFFSAASQETKASVSYQLASGKDQGFRRKRWEQGEQCRKEFTKQYMRAVKNSCHTSLQIFHQQNSHSFHLSLLRAKSVSSPSKPHSAPESQGRPIPNKPKGRRKFSEKNIDPFQNIGMKIQRYWSNEKANLRSSCGRN